MFRDKLNQIRGALGTVTRVAWAIFGIVLGIMLITLGSSVNMLPIEPLWKYVLFLLGCLAIAGIALKFLYSHYALHDDTNSEQEGDEQSDDTDSVERVIPAKPESPPTIGTDTEESVDQVLKDIRNRLNTDAQDRKRAEEEKKQDAEAKAKLLADDTIYYDERPTPPYFFLRGFWKMLIAWAVASTAIYLVLSAATSNDNQPPVLFVLIILAITVWYSVRCYGEWAWTSRRQEGNHVVVQEASNGWFGLFGKLYKISLLECGNVVIGKTWYERILRLSSGTVSIETPLDNKKPGDSEAKVHDVFKNLRNMRDPERFQSLVLKRHDELTFGQPDVIRRSDK